VTGQENGDERALLCIDTSLEKGSLSSFTTTSLRHKEKKSRTFLKGIDSKGR